MQEFIKAFIRDAGGAWRCVKHADVSLPGGRIQVTPGSVFMQGTRFMNVDLAALLEDEYRRQARK